MRRAQLSIYRSDGSELEVLKSGQVLRDEAGNITGAVESTADSVEKIVTEISATRITERGATRADDRTSEAAMEDRKKEGYF